MSEKERERKRSDKVTPSSRIECEEARKSEDEVKDEHEGTKREEKGGRG